MSSDPRTLQHRVHAILRTATDMLDLPLGTQHVERLAVEVTPAVRALLAEVLDGAAAEVPVRYAVVAPDIDPVAHIAVDTEAGVETTEYAGCVSRIALDVDCDSPAAALAVELRQQEDVVMTDVPNGDYLGLTVRPQTLDGWRWWLRRFGIAESAVTVQGTNAYAAGRTDKVAVHLCGEDTGTLLSSEVTVRPGLDIDLDTPAGTVAAKVRRQHDVTGVELRDAHTIAVTIRATSLVEWQWWFTQIAADPASVAFEGTTAIVTGTKDGASVELHGQDCRSFYVEDLAAARLMGLLAPSAASGS
ncbi:hypothetical protein ACFXPN_29355 [Streptomyces griseorubiginosus]|uniref:hypothetical protein n=1 Tax=Streptomyces griseorubiginosus TaxID=67304 RepID=UPI0036A141A6